MKKLLLLLAATVLFFSGAVASEFALLLEEHGLKFSLLSFQRSDGQAVLTLRCENFENTDRTILLFAPSANGQPAGFLYGWPTDEITLCPMGIQEEQVTICTDNPSDWIETIAFRFIDAGAISNEVAIDLSLKTATPATFCWQEKEKILVSSGIEKTEISEAPIHLQDRLTPSQLELLDYGQLRIALMLRTGDKLQLLPFASVPTEVSADGIVFATYSGNALICNIIPQFPIQMTENHTDKICTYQADDLTLSGPFVFYATLRLTLREDRAENTVCLLENALDSFDTGPLYANLPLSLFDTIMLSHPMYRITSDEDAIQFEEADIYAQTLLLEVPLSFSLISADELGEIVAYFEYFFHDGTDVIHPIIPLGNN